MNKLRGNFYKELESVPFFWKIYID
jgi:hypothetical protein